jgi:DNA polymerase III subunit delta'
MPFRELTGNQSIKQALLSYLRHDRIPSSMIFAGPDGSSKLDFALTFAKVLACAEGGDVACNRCRSCLAIDRHQFPDVLEFEPEGQYYRKAQIDELISTALLKPLQAKRRIFILKDVQQMNENSANAFLKTLEEPSAHAVFILLTNNLNQLLPTIKSRCQILKFLPLSHEELGLELKKLGLDPARAWLLSRVDPADIRHMTGDDWKTLEDQRAAALQILESLLRQSGVEDVLLDLYDRSRNRDDFILYLTQLVNLLSVLLRDIMVLKVGGDPKQLVNGDYRARLQDACGLLTIDKIFFLIRKMELLLRDVQRNLNVRVMIIEFINSFSAPDGEDG